MRNIIPGLLCAGIAAVEGAAVPSSRSVSKRQDQEPFSLPQYNINSSARVAGIEAKREGWVYGPSIAGNTSFYPTGSLGDAAVEADNTAAFAFRK